MLLAVVLQIVGAVFVVAAAAVLFGFAVGLLVAGVVVFAAGYAYEHGGS